MLLLTSPNDSVQIVTSAAAIINVHTSWVDTNTGTGAITPGRTNTAVSAAATTGVAGSPAAGTQRNVKTLNIRNVDATLPCDITVQHTDGTIVAQLYKRTLAVGDMLEYSDQAGFSWLTASGASGGGAGGGGGGGFTTGDIKPTLKSVADTGWIIPNDGSIGNAASGATTRANADTQALFSLLWPGTLLAAKVCTISIASPAVITASAHGLNVGQAVSFSTTGTLPTGIVAGTTYYVISTGFTASHFRISATPGGTAINTSGTQSGTQQVAGYMALAVQDSTGAVVTRGANAAADYAANRRLVLPLIVGRVLAQAGAGAGLAIHSLADTIGGETCTPTEATLASHTHQFLGGQDGINRPPLSDGPVPGNNNFTFSGTDSMQYIAMQPDGGGQPFNIMQPTTYVNYMIKL